MLPERPFPRHLLLPLLVGLTLGVFLLDVLTPRGLAVWVFYLVPMVLTARGKRARLPLWYGAVVTPLIPVGLLLSPGPAPTLLNYANRLIAVAVIWCAALVNWRYQTARANLTEREGQLRLFIEHSPASVAMFDREMRYLAASRRWLSDFHLEKQPILGASHYAIFTDLPHAWREAHQRGLAGEVVTANQDRYDRAGGTSQFLNWEVRPWYLSDGSIGGIVILAEDISQEVADRESLRASEERLRLTLDSARMGIYDWDIGSGRITWSRWHEQLWGYRPGEFDGTLAGFAARVHPADLPGLEAELARSRDTRALYSHEFRVVWPDSSVHWMLGYGQYAYDGAGTPTGMRGVVMDVTERRQREAALARSSEQLAALSARLDHSREAERARLSREIHDELGQLLTGIKMDLRWAERRLDDRFRDDPSVNPVLDHLVGAGELADQVIGAVQRIAAELRPVALDALGLGAALHQEAVQFTRRTGVECQVDFPSPEPVLEVDTATSLFRIAQEALTNVTRHAGASRVAITLRCTGAWCTLIVRDDGRGAASLDPDGPESLGLFGMRERARLAGGDFAIVTEPGQGLTVRVDVPVTASRGATR